MEPMPRLGGFEGVSCHPSSIPFARGQPKALDVWVESLADEVTSPSDTASQSSGSQSTPVLPSPQGRLAVRWLSTQRSEPLLNGSSHLGHSLWSPQLHVELPKYESASQFVGKVEIYKSRYSVVWSCYCRATNYPVVVKAYEKKRMSARHKKNAAREIAILTNLHDRESDRFPGVIGLRGTFEDRQYIYIVQDKCSKGDLFKQLLRKGGTMEESRVCSEVVVPLLLTLDHLHERKLVHRDIKPENIFFAEGDELKLGDFGLAIDLNTDKPISRVGTLDYMAPEVLAMPTPEQIVQNGIDVSSIQGYNEKVDIWALGILVYELLAGRPPFEVEDPDQTALLIMNANLEHFPPQMGHLASSFIKQTLIKNPAERLSARALLQHPWVKQHYLIGPCLLQEIPLQGGACEESSGFTSPSSRTGTKPAAGGVMQEPGHTWAPGLQGMPTREAGSSNESSLPAAREGSNTCGTFVAKVPANCGLRKSESRCSIGSPSLRPFSSVGHAAPCGSLLENRAVRPRWQSCPGGSLSCSSRLRADEESPVQVSLMPSELESPVSPCSPIAAEPGLSSRLDAKLLAAWKERLSQPPLQARQAEALHTRPDSHGPVQPVIVTAIHSPPASPGGSRLGKPSRLGSFTPPLQVPSRLGSYETAPSRDKSGVEHFLKDPNRQVAASSHQRVKNYIAHQRLVGSVPGHEGSGR